MGVYDVITLSVSVGKLFIVQGHGYRGFYSGENKQTVVSCFVFIRSWM
jgi:hypothetical protein